MNTKKSVLFSMVGVLGAIVLNSCVSIPKGATAVTPFDKAKYIGTWYEIARMDFRFERNLDHTTATYSIKKDGRIQVDNRGFNYKTKSWKQAIGNAKFVGDTNVARLKVSFFGPFYSGYNVIALDTAYQYALVAGNNVHYLWILSRKRTIPENVKQHYLKIAEGLGYKTSSLIWVNQDQK